MKEIIAVFLQLLSLFVLLTSAAQEMQMAERSHIKPCDVPCNRKLTWERCYMCEKKRYYLFQNNCSAQLFFKCCNKTRLTMVTTPGPKNNKFGPCAGKSLILQPFPCTNVIKSKTGVSLG